jgi:hypothetical protein
VLTGDTVILTRVDFFNLATVPEIAQTITFNNVFIYINNSVTLDGTSGNIHTFLNSSPLSAWVIYKTSGTVFAEYVDIQRSIATGGASFIYGFHSTADTFSQENGWLPLTLPFGMSVKSLVSTELQGQSLPTTEFKTKSLSSTELKGVSLILGG